MPPQANAPQKIGRYEVVGELGKGAMGQVYKALDPMIGRTVAMKTMRMDVHGMEAEEMLKRFQNEARAAGVLNHRNIVTIFDAGEHDGMFYIAMEVIEGVTLHSLIAQGRVLPVDQTIEISRQVLAGLDYAHSHGVIHRDVKPANIMIMPDETVKIMDFGIAKSGGGLTSAGQVLGTPNYMSPEQVKGRTLDGRSDLFSFGVILYEMVTGEKPFTGQNVTTIIYKIVNEEPIPPRELDVTIHPGLSAVITKSLAKGPDDRYQTGAALVKELANYKTFGSSGEQAAGAALNSLATDKTAVFDSQAMAKVGSGSMPAQPDPPAPAATIPAAAKAPMKGIDSTVDVGRKGPGPPPAAAPKSGPKTLLIGGAVLALLLVAGAVGWVRHRSADQQAEEQQAAAQQKAASEQAVKSTPSPAPTGKPSTSETTSAKPAAKPKPAATPAKPAAQPAKTGTTPPVAGPATTGDLQVSSTPAGAQVQVDGNLHGTTPFSTRNLSPGQHTVVISKEGYQSATRVIAVTAGKTTPLAVNLASAPTATLKLTSQPAGAAIFLDGKDSGKVTPAQLAADPGAHKILLRKDGFKDAAMTTPNLAAGQSFAFAPLLQAGKNDENPFKKLFGSGIPEGKGMANFKTSPKGAQVMMNGYSAPKLTPCKLPLDPGTYAVTFQLAGYKPAKKSVTIEKGKTAEVDVTLEKQ